MSEELLDGGPSPTRCALSLRLRVSCSPLNLAQCVYESVSESFLVSEVPLYFVVPVPGLRTRHTLEPLTSHWSHWLGTALPGPRRLGSSPKQISTLTVHKP